VEEAARKRRLLLCHPERAQRVEGSAPSAAVQRRVPGSATGFGGKCRINCFPGRVPHGLV